MKTTLNIDEQLIMELRHEAARQGRTMSDLAEIAFRLLLRTQWTTGEPPPLPSFHGGGTFVDIADRDGLYEAMERR